MPYNARSIAFRALLGGAREASSAGLDDDGDSNRWGQSRSSSNGGRIYIKFGLLK